MRPVEPCAVHVRQREKDWEEKKGHPWPGNSYRRIGKVDRIPNSEHVRERTQLLQCAPWGVADPWISRRWMDPFGNVPDSQTQPRPCRAMANTRNLSRICWIWKIQVGSFGCWSRYCYRLSGSTERVTALGKDLWGSVPRTETSSEPFSSGFFFFFLFYFAWMDGLFLGEIVSYVLGYFCVFFCVCLGSIRIDGVV